MRSSRLRRSAQTCAAVGQRFGRGPALDTHQARIGSTSEGKTLRLVVDVRMAMTVAHAIRPQATHWPPIRQLMSSRSTYSHPCTCRAKNAVLEQTQAWFDAYASDIGYDVQDLHVDGDLGFCSFLYHVSGTIVAGGDVNMWVQATLCSHARRICRHRLGAVHASRPGRPSRC